MLQKREKGRIAVANIVSRACARTIAKVFKQMWKSGLTTKNQRYFPVELSTIFSRRLRDLADYWESYVEKYGQ